MPGPLSLAKPGSDNPDITYPIYCCRVQGKMANVTGLATTPPPPYWAVIFTSRLAPSAGDTGYEDTARRMIQLSAEQPGFLGVDSAREDVGITVCYWADEASIQVWKRHADHQFAQYEGRDRWYDAYELRIARVERAYGFERDA
jgi:heme-degrading monooxygenase HmoA